MAGRKSTQRTEQERARVYAARTAWHDGQIRRRIRDNALIGVVGGLLVVGAIASQAVHAEVVTPAPVETGTPSPTPTPTLEPLLPQTTPAPTE